MNQELMHLSSFKNTFCEIFTKAANMNKFWESRHKKHIHSAKNCCINQHMGNVPWREQLQDFKSPAFQFSAGKKFHKKSGLIYHVMLMCHCVMYGVEQK